MQKVIKPINISLQVILLLLFGSFSGEAQITSEFVSLKPRRFIEFNYTGGIQQWVVPVGVNMIYVEVYGAQGGNFNARQGGLGGRVRCLLPVNANDTLYITVGGQSTTNIAAYGFGGNGGTAIYQGVINTSRSGGGLSAISSIYPVNQSNAFVIAGGGGGATGGTQALTAGFAGGSNGQNGSGVWGSASLFGRGGSQVAGGAAGSPFDVNSTLPSPGTAISGGEGGSLTQTYSFGWNGGGGGGGGFFGGGGGAGGGNAQGSGGGGSSWAHSSCINVQNQGNIKTGHGRVLIYY